MFVFWTDASSDRYVQQYLAFRDRNRNRDEFMEHDEVCDEDAKIQSH